MELRTERGAAAAVRQELRPMLRLALPVILAELAWMGMGVVDVVMVGRLGAASLGGASLGRAVFLTAGVLGIGMLLGLDTVVSNAFGAGTLRQGRIALLHGVYLAVVMAVPLALAVRLAGGALDRWGADPAVQPLALAYIDAVSWSMLPLLLYAAFRRYLQAVNLVRPVMIAIVTANVVNVVCNWVLIFGRLGAPALGVAGAGWASCAACAYMAAFLGIAAWLHGREDPAGRGISPGIDLAVVRRLIALGSPAATQLVLEVGVFALVTALASRLDPTSLAAHQVALTAASVTFMIPLGLSSAAAVRVGQALGRGEPAAAARAGWTALLLAAGFMSAAAVVFVTLPVPLVRLFTDDAGVVRTGRVLLLIAAAFQLFDGLQVVATGALRGAGDTRWPMLWNLVGYWLLGLPVGWSLAFPGGVGVPGLWTGLCLGLLTTGTVLLWVWARRVTRFGHGAAHPGADPPKTTPGDR